MPAATCRGALLVLAAVLAALCGPCAAQIPRPACENSNTVYDLMASDPSHALGRKIIDNLGANIFLMNAFINSTAFVPTDEFLKAGLAKYAGLQEIDLETVGFGPEILGAVYAVTEGSYSPDALLSIPSVNTVMGMLNGTDFTVTVTKDGDGQLYFTSLTEGNIARVVETKIACNGYFYKLDAMLLPSETATEIPSRFGYGTQLLEIFMNGSKCGVPLPQTVAQLPDSAEWLEIWKQTGMDSPLSAWNLSATIFVPQSGQASAGNAGGVMYNMLRGAYCPTELTAAGSKNSMLGEAAGLDLPLSFSNDFGTLVITGRFGTARVLNVSIACNSVVYTIDVALEPPLDNQLLDVSPPFTLPTLPVRHMTCNPPVLGPIYGKLVGDGKQSNAAPGNANGSAALPTQPSSGSNTAVVVGVAVGAFFIVVLAAAAAFVWIRRKRRRGDSIVSLTPAALGNEKAGAAEIELKASTPRYCLAADIFSSSSTKPHVGNRSDETPLCDINTDLEDFHPANQIARLAAMGATPYDLWEINTADVEVALHPDGGPVELGRGSFGAVYRGTLRGVQTAAIKVLSADVGSDAGAAIQREAAILKHVNRDRNVVQLYGTCKMPDGKLLLVMELMEGGDLRRALNNPETAEALAWQHGGKPVALDITRGLTALHAINVIHRDLKSKNILLTSTLTAKVADVGIAAVHSQGYLTASAGQVIGTLAWSAPELLLGGRCTEKVDIYSLGIVLWELATGKTPQRGFTQQQQPSDRCPAELVALIAECTLPNPSDRPNAKEVYGRLLRVPPVQGV